jgi:transcriptional regulator with XRE-family HTH domain
MFAKRLEKLRHEKDLTHQQMADMLGITRQAYGNYENAKREPDIKTLNVLADFFNVSMDYLLGKSHVRNSQNQYEPTFTEIEDVINKADLQFNGAPLNDEDKEDIIEFIKVVLRRNKKRESEQHGQATE